MSSNYALFRKLTQVASLQCNGYTDGGVIGSEPAPIYATVSAGSQVNLNWTTWPDSYAPLTHSAWLWRLLTCTISLPRHVGPMITYLARAPSDITKWQPGNA